MHAHASIRTILDILILSYITDRIFYSSLRLFTPSLTPPPLPRYQNSSPVVDPTVLPQPHPLASLAIFFHRCRVSLRDKQTKIYTQATETEEAKYLANVLAFHGLSDGQEQTIDTNTDGEMSPV